MFRYYATVHPLKKRISAMARARMLCAIWLPRALRRGRPDHLRGVLARIGDPAARLCLQHAAPQLYIASGNGVRVLIVHLRQTASRHDAGQLDAPDQNAAQRAHERKIFRLVTLLVAAYPCLHIWLIGLLIQLLYHLCAMSSCCCNPFRTELRKLFPCRRRCCNSSVSDG
ncbi:hypothetical protein KOW79_014176 [Hemibagrus wyckioides]|uniref:Uncharacterized protein n=1 Tax=Hemibagrus wyckioides TaxID=337641 RepID=A0A9D3NKW2_9TELE|nr:hypothetical protein KOW79_014176 [Hemibagrus wyckioides]